MKLIDYDNKGLIARIMVVPSIKDAPEPPPFVIPNDPRIFERIEVADDTNVSYDKHYVLNNELADRPEWTPTVSSDSIPADGVTAIKILGTPARTRVDLFGPAIDSWEGEAGDIEVAVGLPGDYKLKLEAFPYQVVEVKFNATESHPWYAGSAQGAAQRIS